MYVIVHVYLTPVFHLRVPLMVTLELVHEQKFVHVPNRFRTASAYLVNQCSLVSCNLSCLKTSVRAEKKHLTNAINSC